MIADIFPIIVINILYYGLFCLLIVLFSKNVSVRKSNKIIIDRKNPYSLPKPIPLNKIFRFILIMILVVFNALFFGFYQPDGSNSFGTDAFSFFIFVAICYFFVKKISTKIILNKEITSQGKTALFIILLLLGSVIFASQSSTLVNENGKFTHLQSSITPSPDFSHFAYLLTYRNHWYLVIESIQDNSIKEDVIDINSYICSAYIWSQSYCPHSNENLAISLLFSEDSNHLFIYSNILSSIFDYNINERQINSIVFDERISYNIIDDNHTYFSILHSFFSINSNLWVIWHFKTSNNTIQVKLTNINNFQSIKLNLNISNSPENLQFFDDGIISISHDFSKIFLVAYSNYLDDNNYDRYLYAFNLENLLQKNYFSEKTNDYDISNMNWINNSSVFYYLSHSSSSFGHINSINFSGSSFKHLNIDSTTKYAIINENGDYLATNNGIYRNLDNAVLLKYSISSYKNLYINYWDNSLSMFISENQIFNYDLSSNRVSHVRYLQSSLFKEEKSIFSNLFMINLIILVTFPFLYVLVNKKLIEKKTINDRENLSTDLN